MKRSKPMKRTALKRRHPMKRAGKTTLARKKSVTEAARAYFEAFGWQDEDGLAAPCQLSGLTIRPWNAVAHHKTPRSEMRKEGVRDLDEANRLVIVHKLLHIAVIHGYEMGRPKRDEARRMFELVEQSEANAENGNIVNLSEQDRHDIELFVRRGML